MSIFSQINWLRSGALNALKWSTLDAVLRQSVQFVVLIFLGRILAPADFGLVAMLGIFVGIANIFIDGGFSASLIQKKEITSAESSAVFFFNLLMSSVVTLVLCYAAKDISVFFNEPMLEFITYAMAFNLILTALSAIHITLLIREMNFEVLAKVSLIASVISGGVAVIMAFMNLGVWALVSQVIIGSSVSLVLLWYMHSWRPILSFNFQTLRSFLGFSGFVFFSAFLDVAYTRLNLLLIGKFYSAKDLGFFDRASAIKQAPVGILESIFNRIAFPYFSQQTANQRPLIDVVRPMLILMMLINIPLMLGLAIMAEPVMTILLGKKWVNASLILQILCLVGLMWPLHTINLNVLLAAGRSDLFFKLEVIKKTLGILLILSACQYGAAAIAWAMVVNSIFAYFINSYYSELLMGYGLKKQVSDLFFLSSVSVVIALIGRYLEIVVLGSPFEKIIIIVIVCGGLYWALAISVLKHPRVGVVFKQFLIKG